MTDRSTCESPVKVVWDICDEMRKTVNVPARHLVIEAATKAGVCLGTAKTQYSYWKRFHKTKED
jgi:hypothetical protein